MAEESQVSTTTKSDLNRIQQLLTGNSVSNLRIGIAKIQRRILVYTTRLTELRRNEAILKARIYNNVDQNQITVNFAAGLNTQSIPVQALEPGDRPPSPHQSINYAKHNLYSTSVGVKEMDSEINRVNTEIKFIMTQINAYQANLDLFKSALVQAEQTKSKNLMNRIGRAINPSPEDLQKDQVSRSIIANLLLLQQLNIFYFDMTFNTSTNKRAYPDEVKLPETLLRTRQIFWATAQQFPQFIQTDISKGYKLLNFDDPGDPENKSIIENEVAVYRSVGKNSKISADIDQFIKDNVTVLNDSLISKGIERKSDQVISPSLSLNEKTRTYPAVALSMGELYFGSFEILSIKDAIKKWWKKKNGEFFPLPLCPNIPMPSPTSADPKNAAADFAIQALIDAGAKNFNDAQAAARSQQAERNKFNRADLPKSAPDWVVRYVDAFHDGPSGTVNFDTGAHLVTHSFSTNSIIDALHQARAILVADVPIDQVGTEIDNFNYQSNGIFQVYVVWETES